MWFYTALFIEENYGKNILWDDSCVLEMIMFKA
jgi:hypothetical protein